MGSSSADRSVGRVSYAPLTLQITNWPLRDNRVRACAAIAGMLAVAIFAGAFADSVAMGMVAFAALAFAGWRLWIPVRFEFGPKGIVQTVLGRQRRIPWVALMRYEVRRHGVLLLADAEPSPLAALRGLYVRWQDRRDDLLEILEFFMNSRTTFVGSTRTYHG